MDVGHLAVASCVCFACISLSAWFGSGGLPAHLSWWIGPGDLHHRYILPIARGDEGQIRLSSSLLILSCNILELFEHITLRQWGIAQPLHREISTRTPFMRQASLSDCHQWNRSYITTRMSLFQSVLTGESWSEVTIESALDLLFQRSTISVLHSMKRMPISSVLENITIGCPQSELVIPF